MSKPKLFCFTYAGGTASFFDVIEKDLPEYELVKMEYKGHGARHKEQFYHSFEELADDMTALLKKNYFGEEYALFGYSMGSIALVEILKRIIADPSMPPPFHVFLAAHEPHEKAELAGFTDDELDEWVKNRTIRFGAVPEKLLNNRSFWRVYLPIYRADFGIISNYRFENLPLRTTIPVSVFYSETDTPRKEMELWKKYFTGECEFFQFGGTHFFIQAHHAEIADAIRSAWEINK